MLTLKVSSDNLITWSGMKLATTGANVNDATVTWVVKDEAGVAVSGAAGSLTYTGTPGTYQGVCESTVVLSDGATYYLEVTAVSGNANGFRRVECIAEYADES